MRLWLHTGANSTRTTTRPLRCAVLLAAVAAAACNGAPAGSTPAAGDASPPPGTTGQQSAAQAPRQDAPSPRARKDAAMNELAAFVPAGAKLLDSQQGDLDGRGGGALLVIDPPASGGEKLGEGEPRTVLLLTRDGAGALREAARNARIVPCARCGGTAGDPFGYARIDQGGFTLAVSGGSRERWSDAYTFRFDPARNGWLLDKAVREVIDNASEEYKRLELDGADFGDVTFSEFDPAALPQARLEGDTQAE